MKSVIRRSETRLMASWAYPMGEGRIYANLKSSATYRSILGILIISDSYYCVIESKYKKLTMGRSRCYESVSGLMNSPHP